MKIIKAIAAGVSATAGAVGLAAASGSPHWYVYVSAIGVGLVAFVATYAAPPNQP